MTAKTLTNNKRDSGKAIGENNEVDGNNANLSTEHLLIISVYLSYVVTIIGAFWVLKAAA